MAAHGARTRRVPRRMVNRDGSSRGREARSRSVEAAWLMIATRRSTGASTVRRWRASRHIGFTTHLACRRSVSPRFRCRVTAHHQFRAICMRSDDSANWLSRRSWALIATLARRLFGSCESNVRQLKAPLGRSNGRPDGPKWSFDTGIVPSAPAERRRQSHATRPL